MVIDSHSHVGKDYYNGSRSISEYINFCKKVKIDKGILMPTPWPCIEIGKKTYCSLVWEHTNYKKRDFYRVAIDDNKIEKISENPYKIVNDRIYSEILSNVDKMDLYFAPLLHGVLDNPQYLEELLKKQRIVAIKIHGFGSGYTIENIKHDIIDVLQKYDIPLIIHTSIYNYNYGYGYSTKYWRNLDHPLRWAKFIVDNKLTGILNHGAALNANAIELVNEYENLMIGLGPDLDLNADYFKIDIPKNEYKKSEYLKLIKKSISADKILFDIDYNWNIIPGKNQLDTKSIERVQNNWNNIDAEKILSTNAYKVFKRIRK